MTEYPPSQRQLQILTGRIDRTACATYLFPMASQRFVPLTGVVECYVETGGCALARMIGRVVG